MRYRLSQDAIFKSLKDAIITVDNDMRVLEANKKVKNICGFYRIAIEDHEDKALGAILVIRDITGLNILEGEMKD